MDDSIKISLGMMMWTGIIVLKTRSPVLNAVTMLRVH